MFDMCSCGHNRYDHINPLGQSRTGRCKICRCM